MPLILALGKQREAELYSELLSGKRTKKSSNLMDSNLKRESHKFRTPLPSYPASGHSLPKSLGTQGLTNTDYSVTLLLSPFGDLLG